MDWAEKDQQVIRKEIEEAIQRITCNNVPPQTQIIEELGAFLDRTLAPAKSLKLERKFPFPSAKACFENPVRKGGAAKFLFEKLKDTFAVSNSIQTYVWRDVPKDFKSQREALKKPKYRNARTPKPAVNGKYDGPLPMKYMVHAVLGPLSNKSKCCVNAVLTPDRKVRVVTIHDAYTVWLARAMTTFLMPMLKRTLYTKSILRNQNVRLKPCGESPFVYSADLSKATDPIGIELCKFVLNKIAEHLGKPEWWDTAVEKVIRSHQIFDVDKKTPRGYTQCGALMGLGPGWVVLNVLNAFAAYRAGASPFSFSICGDDLVGYWSKDIADKYEENLSLLGLEANKSKSFRGRNGVFCERPVIVKNDVAVGRPHIRPGDVVSKPSRQQKWVAMVDSMAGIKCSKLLREEANKTRSQCRSNSIPGLFRQGGTDGKSANHVTLLSYIIGGSIPTTPSMYNTKDIERDLSKFKVSTKNGVPLEDVMQAARRAKRYQMLAQGKFEPPRDNLTKKEISIIGSRRKQLLKPLLREKPIKCLKSLRQEGTTILSRLNDVEFRSLTRLVSKKKYNTAIKMLSKATFVIQPKAVKLLFCERALVCEPPIQLNLQPTRQVWNSRPT
jgi:hypothetical protein